ncbi:iron-sulfur cluster biosynthesis family protein [Paucisalibacillus sp. EB02]|uniref:iron-sulfur cluster biosynthesis family protein n=1 Tax=Paucisalibacillus sp. EB02 TaxID=1347087 RepID=UPI0004BBE5AE|nr:iron-sulfur cluster biosynthesis family protein [Paucisalibacillus sp. EB02]
MKLTITEKAISKIQEFNTRNHHYLLLHYDTVGCGCGVNGVPTIGLVDHKDDSHIEVETHAMPTIVNKMQSVFFAENMKLDFVGGTFRLSSPEGILNPFISTTNLMD